MTSPLGKKLRAAGYSSLWGYLNLRGFTDMETFLLRDVDFESVAPVGFEGFVLSCTHLDKQWNKGFRVMSAYELNRARRDYAENTPSPDWIVISPVASLAVHFEEFNKDIPWAADLTFEMRDYLLAHRELFNRPFSWDNEWLVKMAQQASES